MEFWRTKLLILNLKKNVKLLLEVDFLSLLIPISRDLYLQLINNYTGWLLKNEPPIVVTCEHFWISYIFWRHHYTKSNSIWSQKSLNGWILSKNVWESLKTHLLCITFGGPFYRGHPVKAVHHTFQKCVNKIIRKKSFRF